MNDNEELLDAARDLVAKTNAMAGRTSGLHPSLRQPWLRSLQRLASVIAKADGPQWDDAEDDASQDSSASIERPKGT